MRQFTLTGPEGALPVPQGESQIGSDAACPLCVQGEGILPVHAYLSVDGNRLLIRPASLPGNAHAAMSVNGVPIDGPVALKPGQEVTLGTLPLSVSRRYVWPNPWIWRWFRAATWTLSSALVLLVLGFLWVQYVYFDEEKLKKRIADEVSEILHRDGTEIDSIRTHLLSGRIELKNIRIPDREMVGRSETPFISIPAASVKVDLWPLLRSRFRECRNLVIDIQNPEVVFERSKTDGSLNTDDIMARPAVPRKPVDMGLDRLNFTVRIHDGAVRLKDSFLNTGASSLENINIVLRQNGAGQPLVIETCRMTSNFAPAGPRGELSLAGELHAIDASCIFDPAKFSSNALRLKLKDFDLARIFEHFGYAWAPAGESFKVVLGKPLSGEAALTLNRPGDVLLSGKISSPSLLSIKEADRPPLGDIPMDLRCDNLHLVDAGHGYEPRQLDLSLAGGGSADGRARPYVWLTAHGDADPNGAGGHASLDCALAELTSTEIGKRLGLGGLLGGHLHGDLNVLKDAAGSLKVDASLATSDDSFVMVASDMKAGAKLVRQPLPLKFDFHATARTDKGGGISDVNVASFNFSAPALTAHSDRSGIAFPGGKLLAHMVFNLKLQGHEFWAQFTPILALFGFKKPIEEALDLTVLLHGDDEGLHLAFDGTALRQWKKDDPAPLKVNAVFDYYPHAAQLHAANPVEFLKVELRTSSSQGKPLNIFVQAHCSRSVDREIIDLAVRDKNGTERALPGLTVESDVETLRERFAPYIERFVENETEDPGAAHDGWLSFYRDSRLQGSVQESGRIVITHDLNKSWAESGSVDFDLTASGDLAADLPYQHGRWVWREPELKLAAKGSYVQALSDDKEKPDTQRLSFDALELKGRAGTVTVKIAGLDLFALDKLAALPKTTWTDVLAGCNLSAQLDAPAYELLKALNVIPPAEPASGQLDLQLAYDRALDTLSLDHFRLKQTGQFALKELDLNGALQHVREISTHLAPVKPGDSNLAERLSEWFAESGPAMVLDHLGSELAINQLQLDTVPLRDWLARTYGHAGSARKPPALLAGLVAGDWQPQGTWTASGVTLARQGGAQNAQWVLLGKKLRNDFSIYQPGTQNAAFTFAGGWKLTMGLALLPDGTLGAEGDAILDDTELSASLPALKYLYHKPAAAACALKVGDFRFSRGNPLLAHVGDLHLTGAPADLALKDCDAEFVPGAGTRLTVGGFVLNGEPLSCTGTLRKCDLVAGRLDVSVNAPKADLAYVAELLNAPDRLQFSGALKDAAFSYAGGFTGLQNIDPNKDTLEMSAELDHAVARPRQGGGVWTQAELAGSLHVTARDLAWQNCAASLSGATGTVALESPALQVHAADAKQGLLQALHASGLPVNLSGSLKLTSPLGAAQWSLLQDTVGIDSIRSLGASGTVEVPRLTINGMELSDVKAENAMLTGLKAAFPLITASFYGGKLAVSDAHLDIADKVAHRATIKLADADLHALLTPPGYEMGGHLSAAGTLSGDDLSKVSAWNGQIKLTLADISAKPTPRTEMPFAKELAAPWSREFINLGESGYAKLVGAYSAATGPLDSLMEGDTLRAKLLQGALLAGELYLARTCGSRRDAFEFESATTSLTFANGNATVEPFQLNGRGARDGLSLQVTGTKVNTTDGTFTAGPALYPLKLPAESRQALSLDKWPAPVRTDYVAALTGGKLPLRLSGPLAAPEVSFPWPELKSFGRRALFGAERIATRDGFDKAMDFLHKNWEGNPADLALAAALGDRFGVGLPATAEARQRGETIVDHVPNLPPTLTRWLSTPGQTLEPLDSLKRLLRSEEP